MVLQRLLAVVPSELAVVPSELTLQNDAERLLFVTVTMCAPHHAVIYYDVANRISRVRYISTRPLSDETAPYQTLGVFILLQLIISGAIERDASPSVAHCMPARDLSLYPQLSTAACSSRTQPVG